MDTELFSARINDLYYLCLKTSKPQFTGFMGIDKQAQAEKILKNLGADYTLFGGHENAERRILAVTPFEINESAFPLCAVTFTYKSEYKLTHRDFLGALMSVGLERRTVGDILVGSGKTVVFLKREIADFVKLQIGKVGSVGVQINDGFTYPLPEFGELKSFRGTVASNRLDGVLSLFTGASRAASEKLILDGLVTLGGSQIKKPTASVKSGDVLSVKGKGRFIIDNIGGLSKKGRITVNYSKYV